MDRNRTGAAPGEAIPHGTRSPGSRYLPHPGVGGPFQLTAEFDEALRALGENLELVLGHRFIVPKTR